MQIQLAKLEHDQQRGAEKKMAELKDQIRKAEIDDQAQEKEVELLKRKAVRESEHLKWEAMREVSVQRYPLHFILRVLSVRGETRFTVSSCGAHHWGATFYSTYRDNPVHWCTSYGRRSCFASASPRQLQDGPYQLTPSAVGDGPP